MSSVPFELVSEHEYLHTTYRPDCDYVDGFVFERNLGQFDHSRLQGLVLLALAMHERDWNIIASRAAPENPCAQIPGSRCHHP